jgi:hypothetical protein
MALPTTREKAFLYCWTDNSNSMLYVGVHKGEETKRKISESIAKMLETRRRNKEAKNGITD